jgi:hypothetical protein
MLLAVACFYKARVNKVQADAYLAELNKWRAAKARWDLLYYCPACNAVFLPGQSACSPADQIAEYLPEAQ